MSRFRARFWCVAYDATSWLQSVVPPVPALSVRAYDLNAWVGRRMSEAVFAAEDERPAPPTQPTTRHRSDER